MIQSFEEHAPRLPAEYYVADNARVIGNVELHNQTSIWFGAVLRGDIEPITIGERSNIQDNSVAHTSRGLPVVIGSNVTVGHNVTLHACRVGNNCLIGMGAILLDGCEVGDNCIIGSGTLVKQGQRIPPGSLAVGLPARVIRSITDAEKASIQTNADRYVALLKQYRNGRVEAL
jgi:carbonic anhydrase/acetyltransferase-like protein (isoleucine patch superfamily)